MRYEIGLYWGSFDPLHLGHVDCLIQAASSCETLYVLLSVGTQRDEIEPRIRYRWLYQVTQHFGNVRILPFEDDAPSKAAYSQTAAASDNQKLRALIGSPIDVVFFGSDYTETHPVRRLFSDCRQVIFPRSPINSTQLRQAPLKHWDWLPNVVKPYYAKKVLLIGGESTGKTTLTISLAQHYSTNYVEEAGRELSMRSGTDERMLPEDFTEILLQHKLNELRALGACNRVLFIDTDALTTRFFLHFFKETSSRENLALSEAIDALDHYDLILFLEADVAFVQDGGRSEKMRCDRSRYSEQLKREFIEQGRHFICIGGDYLTRYTRAVEEVDALLDKEGACSHEGS